MDLVVDELQTKTSSVFVFANTRCLTHNLVKGLETKCDSRGVDGDVVHIHGMLEKEEKFHLINFFCRKETISEYNP